MWSDSGDGLPCQWDQAQIVAEVLEVILGEDYGAIQVPGQFECADYLRWVDLRFSDGGKERRNCYTFAEIPFIVEGLVGG